MGLILNPGMVHGTKKMDGSVLFGPNNTFDAGSMDANEPICGPTFRIFSNLFKNVLSYNSLFPPYK